MRQEERIDDQQEPRLPLSEQNLQHLVETIPVLV